MRGLKGFEEHGLLLIIILNTLNFTLYLTMPYAAGKNLSAITDMTLGAIVHLFDDHFLLHIRSGHLLL